MNTNEKTFPLILLIIVQPFFLVLLNLANFNAKAHSMGTIAAQNSVIGILSVVLTVCALTFVKKIVQAVEQETETRVQLENQENIQEMLHTMRSQRHDFNNHIQTVHGLINVGAYEEAQKYINKVVIPVQTSNKLLSDNPSVTALLQVKANCAESRGIKADFSIDGSLKTPMVPVKDLNTVLGNLIDNAIEAVEGWGGKKVITVRITSRPDRLAISVFNTGPGLSEQLKQKIFQPGFTTKQHGHGIGLWSVRKIIGAYGGNIDVKNEAEGVRFKADFMS